MRRLESSPELNFVSSVLLAEVKVEVRATYKIADICTDSMSLGSVTLKTDTPVFVVDSPDSTGMRPATYELDSSDCEQLRIQGSYDRAKKVREMINRGFMVDNPILLVRARRNRRKAFRKPMTLDHILSLQLEVWQD
jgi:hypothetical protein